MLRPDLSDGALPRFEGWETLEKLGEGGMCVVYRARPEGGGPERAVKVLTDRSKAAIRRFMDEGRLLQRIDHPNVVKVHAISDDDRPPWLVMDMLGGRDLEETMKVEGPMDPERAAMLFADLSSALATVHAAGVRHRDIKPANIRLGDDGIGRLIDFGIARDANTERVTRSGLVVGTASYLPPEIFTEEDANQVQDTEAADVYALGQTLCELLAGKPVHGGRERGTEASLLVRIMRDKLDRDFLDPRDFGVKVPDGLCRVVRHATMREPQERLQNASDLEAELRSWLESRRSQASMAPLTRIDPSTLAAPLPPTPSAEGLPPARLEPPPTVSPPSSATPAPAEPTSRTGAVATTAAVGAVGAMGIAGVGVIAAAVVVCLVLLGVAAWMFTANSDESRLRAEVDRQATELSRCRPSSEIAEIVLVLTVEDHRTRSVTVSGDPGGRIGRCAERVLERRRWTVGGPITVEVPVQFR
ncbi:MAG: serine/threonine protein kinase [Alphaproteobacteria bacterium]|nr:serine/threonine protein kinase [Alphaproteobacteria bacterium]MCB9698538.1 serine/threonine protein kinase [Alphaproteobacteria bacterium]